MSPMTIAVCGIISRAYEHHPRLTHDPSETASLREAHLGFVVDLATLDLDALGRPRL
jgi:hypothetical protein